VIQQTQLPAIRNLLSHGKRHPFRAIAYTSRSGVFIGGEGVKAKSHAIMSKPDAKNLADNGPCISMKIANAAEIAAKLRRRQPGLTSNPSMSAPSRKAGAATPRHPQ
jgi:hypothetical protein